MAKKFQPVHPSRRGEFTAAATAHHMTPLQYAHHVTGDPDASSERKHQASFVEAVHSPKWDNGKRPG